MMKEITAADIVTDDEIDKAFENTRFGPTPRRELIWDGLIKAACDYHSGSTMQAIMRELGLVGKSKRLTKKGQRYLRTQYDHLINIRQ